MLMNRTIACYLVSPTSAAGDRIVDPGDQFQGQHRSKVSSQGGNSALKILDGDALDSTATKLQVCGLAVVQTDRQTDKHQWREERQDTP